MNKMLNHSGQVAVIALSDNDGIQINHYLVLPDKKFCVSNDVREPLANFLIETNRDMNDTPESAAFLMDYFRQICNNGTDEILGGLHTPAKLAGALLGEGNYVFDLVSGFYFPYALSDEYFSCFIKKVADDQIPYFYHAPRSGQTKQLH